MKDFWHNLTKILDYERWKILGVLIAAGIFLCIIGCQPSIQSPISGKKVTDTGFQLEVDASAAALDSERIKISEEQAAYNVQLKQLQDKLQAGQASLLEKKQLQEKLVNLASGAAVTAVSGGQIDAAGLLVSLLTVMGIGGTVGGMVDSQRKNKIIEQLKNSETGTSANAPANPA